MRFVADLHVHSRYSRATSADMVPAGMWRWAQLKGITVLGTGDFTHPGWFKDLTGMLEPADSGLFVLKKELRANGVPESCRAEVFFLLSAEISCIYRKNDRTRKVHALLFAPDFTTAARIGLALSRIGNIGSDGRPILGIDAKELLRITLDASPEAIFIPAHAWTPHFSVLGASSGFDSLEECFEELTPNIPAIETGLSSDPPMNWRLSSLDGVTLISNSDAHSPPKIGREANIFDADLSYGAIIGAIKTRRGFLGTIEFFPEEGKYHYDGHRACGVTFSPEETIRHNYLCPVCGKRLTVGVAHRVEKLADRAAGYTPEGAPYYRSLIPLPEILSEALKVGVSSKAVGSEYLKLLSRLGNEFGILLDIPLDEIERAGSAPLVREAVARMRAGKVHIAPGYDGEYGKIKIFEESERQGIRGQIDLALRSSHRRGGPRAASGRVEPGGADRGGMVMSLIFEGLNEGQREGGYGYGGTGARGGGAGNGQDPDTRAQDSPSRGSGHRARGDSCHNIHQQGGAGDAGKGTRLLGGGGIDHIRGHLSSPRAQDHQGASS